jgi:hypothetical protein
MRSICALIACSACVAEPVEPTIEATSHVLQIQAPLVHYPKQLLYAVCLPVVRGCEGWLLDILPDATTRERRFAPCGEDECWEMRESSPACPEAPHLELVITAFTPDDADYGFARFECEL